MRRISLLLVFILIVTLFTGCGSVPDASGKEGDPVTISDNQTTVLPVVKDPDEPKASNLPDGTDDLKESFYDDNPGADLDEELLDLNDQNIEENITQPDENHDMNSDSSPDPGNQYTESDDKIIEEPYDEVVFMTPVYSPVEISTDFDYALFKDSHEHDILDMRISVPFLEIESCPFAEVINAFFAEKALSFKSFVEEALLPEASLECEDSVLYSAEMVYSVLFNREGYLSIVTDKYIHSANNEVSVQRDCVVFNINSGKSVSIWDIIDEDVCDAASLTALMTLADEYQDPPNCAELAENFDSAEFALTENGILISYPGSVVIPEYCGIFEFIVPYGVCPMKISFESDISCASTDESDPPCEDSELNGDTNEEQKDNNN